MTSYWTCSNIGTHHIGKRYTQFIGNHYLNRCNRFATHSPSKSHSIPRGVCDNADVEPVAYRSRRAAGPLRAVFLRGGDWMAQVSVAPVWFGRRRRTTTQGKRQRRQQTMTTNGQQTATPKDSDCSLASVVVRCHRPSSLSFVIVVHVVIVRRRSALSASISLQNHSTLKQLILTTQCRTVGAASQQTLKSVPVEHKDRLNHE